MALITRKLEGIVFEGTLECNKHLEEISLKIVENTRGKFTAVLEDQSVSDIEGQISSGFISFRKEIRNEDGDKGYMRYQGKISEEDTIMSIEGTWQYKGEYNIWGKFSLKQQ